MAPIVTSDNTTFVIDACSEFPMNPMVSAPIHAATTTLTATVTAIRMMVAITGLRAFAFFLKFLKFIYFFNLFLELLGKFIWLSY